MTAAMMLPGSAPAVVRAVRAQRGAEPPRAAALTAVGFIAAYGAVWLLAGLAGYACVQGVRALHADVLGWASAGRYLAAAALIAAGLHQFTAVKRRWLARCLSPKGHVGRSGAVGGLRAGAEHGMCCVACCWTLMVALYALGIMSVTWMVVITVLIAAERLAPRTPVAVAAVAAVLLALGVGVAAAPASVPGLTVPPPGHGGAMGMSMR
jgi:predicted metal-binding membrane protein